MDHIHHRPIKRFSLDGVINDDSSIGKFKQEYIRLLNAEMKLNGYAPRLDIDPDFTIQYNTTKDCYEFELSVYGIYVGKKKSQWIIGIDRTRIFIQENKLKELSQVQESTLNQN